MTLFEQLDPALPEARMPSHLDYVLVILLLILNNLEFLFLNGENPGDNTNEHTEFSSAVVSVNQVINGNERSKSPSELQGRFKSNLDHNPAVRFHSHDRLICSISSQSMKTL